MLKLTQKQADELKAKVGEVDYGDPVVRDWVETGLRENAVGEKRLIARFTLMEMLRDDDQMDATAKDLQKTRDVLVALKEMQAKCDGQSPASGSDELNEAQRTLAAIAKKQNKEV